MGRPEAERIGQSVFPRRHQKPRIPIRGFGSNARSHHLSLMNRSSQS